MNEVKVSSIVPKFTDDVGFGANDDKTRHNLKRGYKKSLRGDLSARQFRNMMKKRRRDINDTK